MAGTVQPADDTAPIQLPPSTPSPPPAGPPRAVPPSSGTRRPAPPRRSAPRRAVSSAAQSGAGFLLGIYLLVQVLNYARGGAAGVKAWHRAKFLNRTDTTLPATSPTSPVAAAAPSTPSTASATPSSAPNPDPYAYPPPTVTGGAE